MATQQQYANTVFDVGDHKVSSLLYMHVCIASVSYHCYNYIISLYYRQKMSLIVIATAPGTTLL